MNDVQTGYGGTLSGSLYGTIGNIISVTPPQISSERITQHRITDSDRVARKTVGNADAGEMVVMCTWDQHQYNTLQAGAGKSTSRQAWTLTTPEGSTYIFDGAIADLRPSALDTGSVMTYEWVVPADGPVAFSPQSVVSSSPSSTPSVSPSSSPS